MNTVRRHLEAEGLPRYERKQLRRPSYSQVSFVEFVTDMKVETLIACHDHTFEHFGGVTRKVLYDNMKTVMLARDTSGEGEHCFHTGFLDYACHCIREKIGDKPNAVLSQQTIHPVATHQTARVEQRSFGRLEFSLSTA